jgi:hypothetical protein
MGVLANSSDSSQDESPLLYPTLYPLKPLLGETSEESFKGSADPDMGACLACGMGFAVSVSRGMEPKDRDQNSTSP